VVTLNNGDYITGEIKKLVFGMLTYSTDNAGTLEIKWDKIYSLKTINTFEIETVDGKRYYGSLTDPSQHKYLNIQMGESNIEFPMIEIVFIAPIHNKFWKRLDGDINLGFSYTKASTLAQLNFDSDIKYKHMKYMVEIGYDAVFSTQTNQDPTSRQDFSVSYSRTMNKKWTSTGVVGLQQNSELGLDLRLQAVVGIGRHVIQTNKNDLLVITGFSANREISSGQTDATYNLEAVVDFSYSLYKYDSPKSNITISITSYPGLTDLQRFRLESNLKFSQEIVKDFTVSLTFYDSFDNKPAEGATKNDWGITTSVGYSF